MRHSFLLTCTSIATLSVLTACGGGGASTEVSATSGIVSPSAAADNAPAGLGATATTTTQAPAPVDAPTKTTTSASASPAPSSAAPAAPAPAAPSPAESTPAGLGIGVNIHTGGGSAANNDQVASILASRNIRQARLDLLAGGDFTLVRDQVSKISANGGKAQLVVMNSYQWDNSCNQNVAAVEQDSYDQTSKMVAAMKDLVHDFEMLNEMQIRPDLGGQVTWNSQGASTAAYNNSPCARTLAAVTRGMSRAIHDQGQRAILGALGRDWGFLTFMKEQGVTWDVTGYHIYPHEGDASLLSDPWYGANGPLYQLSMFGKPITVNEFNCGETYDSGFENQAGAPNTEACLRSVTKHLAELRSYKGSVPLESVHFYELVDAPAKAAPENRFGMMYTLASQKVELSLVAAYAGGNLTSSEQQAITSRGLLTDAQIAGMK